MKRFTLLLVVALFVLNANGQTQEKRLAIGLGPGYYFNLGDDGAGGFSIPNFFFSGYLSPRFDLRGKFDVGLKQSNETTSPNYLQIGADLRLKLFNEKSKFQPYLYAGPGYFRDNKGDVGTKTYSGGINFNGGVGTKLRLGPSAALFLEAGYIHGVSGARNIDLDADKEEVHDNFFKLSSIIEFDFTDNDWDNDGVKNKKDKCPRNTVEELAKGVDVNGCPVDLDFDGVPDWRDDCPNTPNGCKVDEKGCPIDTDGDGIMDCADDCPTVKGPEKFKGCPDTDDDGVPDPKDKCPGTPKNISREFGVDVNGCPKDFDGDGVNDQEDACPRVPGKAEYKGCPPPCKDFDIDPVFFDFDKATLRPEGMAALDAFIAKLGDCKDYDVVVDGYTCSIGTKKYNQGLSEERAEAVVKYLISKGLNTAYVAGKGFGEDNPAVPNTNKKNREQNRRAFVQLTIK